MRRIELIDGIDMVAKAITESKLHSSVLAFVKSNEAGKRADSTLLLRSFQLYSIKASAFSSAAREIAEVLKLTDFEDPSFWSTILSAPTAVLERERIWEPLEVATQYLPRLRTLIQQEPIRALSHSAEAEGGKANGRSLLSVILIEDKSRLSSPARIIEVLQSVDWMYEACAEISDLPGEKLSVVACDSGSDKSFDFLGVAKIIECVKEIILSLWDRVIFFREKQLSQRIDLIAAALPIVDQIGTLERDKKLGPEQAELLRRKVLDGVGKFIESGAIIPEIEGRSQFNPRLLMAPEPRLLVGAPEEITAESLDDGREDTGSNRIPNANVDALSNYEREELLRLLQKSKQQKEEGDDQ
jgi:hypothetical protein